MDARADDIVTVHVFVAGRPFVVVTDTVGRTAALLRQLVATFLQAQDDARQNAKRS